MWDQSTACLKFFRIVAALPGKMLVMMPLLLASAAKAQVSSLYTANPVVWVEAEDPVLATSLTQLGPGWYPLPRNLRCSDPLEFKQYNKLCSLVARRVGIKKFSRSPNFLGNS